MSGNDFGFAQKCNRREIDTMNEAITQIALDNTSGAAEILRRAARVFSLLGDEQTYLCVEDVQRAIQETCVALVAAQPDMSPLLKLASATIEAARTATGGDDALKEAKEASKEFVASAERSAQAASLHSASLIHPGAIVMTHSRSSTVLAALLAAARAGKDFAVIATESRPALEGRRLAQTLASQDIRVTVIADAAASTAMDQIDFILVGADTITPREMVNKIGTRVISLAARERGLPMYVVCDTSKFVCSDYSRSSVRSGGSADELWPEMPRGVSTMNRYFEATQLDYFTGIITEDGLLSIEDAACRAQEASIDAALADAIKSIEPRIK